ncbi:MAG: hypothetical protein GDA44_02750 [Prochloron sp. SP5CPC1]|nr:hypothetical protein [Candidatus Paraprochloron terpiosi SP5CPC1]
MSLIPTSLQSTLSFDDLPLRKRPLSSEELTNIMLNYVTKLMTLNVVMMMNVVVHLLAVKLTQRVQLILYWHLHNSSLRPALVGTGNS